MEHTLQNDATTPRRGLLKRLFTDREGVIAIVAAIAFPLLITMAGFGTDVAMWYTAREDMQAAADAAAVAAGLGAEANETTTQIAAEANAVAGINGFANGGGSGTSGPNNISVAVTYPYTYGGNSNNVKVVIQETMPGFLSAALGGGNVTISAQSVAQIPAVTYCTLSLSSTNTTAGTTFGGAGTLNMSNCGVGVNATGTSSSGGQAYALTATGNLFGFTWPCIAPPIIGPSVNAMAYAVVGGIETNSTKNKCLNSTLGASTGINPISDPYSSSVLPTATSVPSTIAALTAQAAPANPATPTIPATPASFTAAAACTTVTTTQALTNGKCYVVTVSAASVTLTSTGTVDLCGVTVATGKTLTLSTGTYKIHPPLASGSTTKCTGAGAGLAVTGGTVTVTGATITSIVGGTATNGLTIGASGTVTLNPGVSVWGTTIPSGTGTIAFNSSSTTCVPGTTGFGTTTTYNACMWNLASAGASVSLPGDVAASSVNITGGTLSVGSGSSEIVTLTVNSGGHTMTLGTGAPGFGGSVWNATVSAGTLTVVGGTSTCSFNGATWTACFYGLSNVGTTSLPAGSVSTGVSSSGTLSYAAGNSTIYGIGVSGGTTTLGAGNYTIIGPNTSAGVTVTGGTMTMAAGTNTIQGPCNASGTYYPAIAVSGGTLTMTGTALTNNILGGVGAAGITLSNSGSVITLSNGTGTTTIEGGAKSYSAGGCTGNAGSNGGDGITMTGGTMTFSANTGVTNILGQTGQQGIDLSGGTLTIGGGTGTNNIQGPASQPSISVTGGGNFITSDNASQIFLVGGQNITSGQPALLVKTNTGSGCGLFSHGGTCANEDVVLGAGTYTFCEGITVTGGNLTLNPNNSTQGTYIVAGGSFQTVSGSGFTIGDINSLDSTIALTNPTVTNCNGTTNSTDYATWNTNGVDGVQLVAPTSGTSSGLAIFQDRSAPSSGTNTMYGLNFMTITGALYFPEQTLNIIGINFIGTNQCMQLISGILYIDGLTFLTDNCSSVGVNLITGIGIGRPLLIL